jgi:hypothetical protein
MFPKEKISFLDFDIYSRRISFFYENKEKIGSSLGFMLTVLYAMISIVLFLYYFIKFIKREEVTASDSTIYPTNFPSIDINNDIFYLAFGMEHPNNLIRYIDERIYYPEVVFVERIKEEGVFSDRKETILNFERCNYLKFGKDYQNLFHKEEVNNSYCLKDFNLTLEGGLKYDRISYIRINIYPCINNTENSNHCLPQNEIDYYLSSTYFSILAKDIGLNPFNYSFPILPVIQDIHTNVDKSSLNEFVINFGITEIDTEKGFFSSSIQKDIYLKYVNSYNSIFFYEDDLKSTKKEILSAQIRLEDNIHFQKRTYFKMSQVLSTTGGYMQVISTIFSLISILTKKISLEKKLLNSLFNFNIRQKKIIFSIEYAKKLDYNSPLNKRKDNTFIPYEARKSIISSLKNRRKSIFVYNKKQPDITPVLKRNISQDHPSIKNINMQNSMIEDGILGIIKKISKKKLKSQNDNNNNTEQNINRSNINMLNKEEISNENQLDKMLEQNKEKTHNYFMDFNLIKDFKFTERGNCSTIKFNLLDYYCFRKITRKKTEIELFRFGINFYKSQMDIINFFNVLFLTQIMLTQQSEKKQDFLSQKIEFNI